MKLDPFDFDLGALLKRYEVKLSATGETTVEIEAISAEAAINLAYQQVPGFIVEGGSVGWEAESVIEIEGSEGNGAAQD